MKAILLIVLFALIVAVGVIQPLAAGGPAPAAPAAPAYQYNGGSGSGGGSYGSPGGGY